MNRLLNSHDTILLCNGAYNARRLTIPGAVNHPRVLNAQSLVAFYNADPFYYPAELISLQNKVGIIGCGNVALDIARILIQPDLLTPTDINSRFISEVTQVHFFIRRGPFDLPCTTRELRELIQLPRLKRIDIHGLDGPLSQCEQFQTLQKSRNLKDRKQKRLLKLLADAEGVEQAEGDKVVNFHFYNTPQSLTGTDELSVTFNHKSGKEQIHQIDWLVESMGYDFSPVSEEVTNVNVQTGRAEYDSNTIYMAGWALSGATGVVGDSTDSSRRVTDRYTQIYLGCCKLENEILKEAKNAQK